MRVLKDQRKVAFCFILFCLKAGMFEHTDRLRERGQWSWRGRRQRESLNDLKGTRLTMRKISLDHVRITPSSKTEISKLYLKGPNSKYFRLFTSQGLCCNYSTRPSDCKKSHRQYINKWAQLSSNKILFTKAYGRPRHYSLPTSTQRLEGRR